MKLCVLSNDYPSTGRPVYTFVEQLVDKLLEEGVKVVVIAPQSVSHAVIRRERILHKVCLANSSSGTQYKVYRPKYLSFGNNTLFDTTLNWYKRRLIRNIIRKEDPNVLYGHFWLNAYLLDDISRDFQKPLFVACGEGDNALEALMRGLPIERKRKLSSSINGMISVSTENKKKCLGIGLIREDNVIVLPNCVEIESFRYDKSLSLRKELGIVDDDFVIAFCGDFEVRKGPNRLSDAIQLLKDKSIKSIFIGRPVSGEHVDPTCDGVVFKGAVEHKDLPKYLNTADVFVLPTRKEGCCNAIVEALACGLPVISSDGAFNDDILNQDNSIRVNPDDIEAIAKAIKLLKENKDMRDSMRDYSLAHHEEYSLNNRAKKIIEFIEVKR